MVEQHLGIVFKGQKFHGGRHESVPSRSGSAPPSMEGSFATVGNLIGQYRGGDRSLASTSGSVMHVSEEKLRADPSYIAYYFSNVNLNPRLPPPLTSRENRHILQQIHRLGDNRKLSSVDDSSKGYLLSSRAPLSTHNEEAEDDSSPRHVSIGTPMSGSEFSAGHLTSSSESRHKSLVDLIQDDFPRIPSPVFTHQPCFTNHGINEVAPLSNSQGDHFHGTRKSPELGNSEGRESLRIYSVDSTTDHDTSKILTSGRSVSENKITRHSVPEENSSLKDVNLAPIPVDSSINRSQHVRQRPLINSHTRATSSQVHTAQSDASPHSRGITHTQNSIDHFPHIQQKILAGADVKLPQKTTAVPQPLYAAVTGYMSSGSPFYSNLQLSSLYAPPYVGGYAINASVMPPFISGYPLAGAFRMGFENSPTVNLNGSGGSAALGTDLPSLYKLYGQLGAAMNPHFCDPLFLPYFQHQSVDAYGSAGQYDHSYDVQKRLPQASYLPEQRSSYLRSGIDIHIPTNCVTSSPSIYGNPSNLGVLMQYPASPIASVQLPGSPMSGSTLPIKKSENLRLPVSSNRCAGSCPGWQGERGRERTDDSKMYSFLEEFKTSKARRFELSDIAGRIIEFSTDQHGSRFIQQKLESCTAEEKSSVFEEVLPHASTLMTDVFGNYVIQKFFEHGNTEQRRQLANQLSGHILHLSLQMYGCRVIQKALEVIELDQKTKLVSELDGHVMRCVRDQNGNHVIQKCIECVPTEKIGFIISSFRGQVANLSTHPYGCRVIQRVLEHCTDELQSQCIVDEVLQSACFLAQDQYGNYVTQHVLERGKPYERSQIITKLAGQIVKMSQNKFASNVIEKCLEHGDAAERELLINEIVGQTEGNENLLIMMKDQYGNYVIQKILETCADKQQETLLNRIRVHLPALRKYTYGKHIVVRVEQLTVGESNTSSG